MEASKHNSLSQKKSYINNIDFSKIIQKMAKRDGWEVKNAIKVSQLYKNYLFLICKYGAQYPNLPPSLEIDEFWHNHILDTQQYIKDCDALFGRFLHHDPYQGIDGKTSKESVCLAFEKLQQLHHEEFGYFILKIRKKQFFNSLAKIFFSLMNLTSLSNHEAAYKRF